MTPIDAKQGKDANARGAHVAADDPTAHIHPLETALVVLVCVHLALLPWMLGTMHVWSQLISLGLSIASLGVAVRARHYPKRREGHAPFFLRTVPGLLRWPPFWVGAIFLGYIAVQGLNPAWELVGPESRRWLRPMDHVAWLPSGFRTPFAESSPWRSLVVYGSAWLSACAVWTGFTRRTTLRVLLGALAVNAGLLAILGLLQKATHADRIFWSWTPPASYFVSSFVYRNHAGAYFDLMLAVTCAVAVSFYLRRGARMERFGPVAILAMVAALLMAIILGSDSRGAVLLMFVFLVGLMSFALRRRFAVGGGTRGGATALVFGAVAMGLIGLGGYALAGNAVGARMKTLSHEIASPDQNTRLLVAKATWELIGDAPLAGWGAGSYPFAFPGYQTRYPEIMTAQDSHKHLLFEHAHSDYLEVAAEVGLAGGGLLLAGWGWTLFAMLRMRVWQSPVVALLFLGAALTCLHAGFDFPFANPALLTTWCVLWPAMQRWLEVEQQHAKAHVDPARPGG